MGQLSHIHVYVFIYVIKIGTYLYVYIIYIYIYMYVCNILWLATQSQTLAPEVSCLRDARFVLKLCPHRESATLSSSTTMLTTE